MKKLWGILFGLMLLVGCEGLDCTINNVVTLNVGFYSSETGGTYSITDTLNVTAEGTDSVLYNRGIRITYVKLPMSYWQKADTLHFNFYNPETDVANDVTLRIDKTNTQHFESPDCPSSMFHEITAVEFECTTGYVDSVIIANTKVNYESSENIKIYLHTAD